LLQEEDSEQLFSKPQQFQLPPYTSVIGLFEGIVGLGISYLLVSDSEKLSR